MEAPDVYVAPYYAATLDPSRRVYAGMLSALDEGVGNITATLKQQGMYNDSVLVLSNDNGGMSGTYGMGCCKCGTSCGGLNYPYRGYKDSFWEGGCCQALGRRLRWHARSPQGAHLSRRRPTPLPALAAGGFRGIGFVHSPLLERRGYVFEPLLWVGDWYKTLLGAALSRDGASGRAAGWSALAPVLRLGPVDSVDQWAALSRGSANGSRTELPLAGFDDDHPQTAALRSGAYKILVGDWGSDQWCDLNISGYSPAYPVPPGDPSTGRAGGEGGLWCMALPPPIGAAADAVAEVGGLRVRLYDVVSDPREQADLAPTRPDLVASLMERLQFWNGTRVPSIHVAGDPNGTSHAEAVNCWSPWE